MWALPSIRALSRRLGQPIDLQIAGEFASIVPLLELQPYLGQIFADPSWALTPPEEWRAPNCEAGPYGPEHDLVLHLGYRGWPTRGLPFETLVTYNQCAIELGIGELSLIHSAELDLQTPWITLPDRAGYPVEVVFGFSECHFELKVGLVVLLGAHLMQPILGLTHAGTAWQTARPRGSYPLLVDQGDWLTHVRALRNADVAVCCNSALHVLAVAVGTPVVLYEPMTSRHNPIFLPLGTSGPQVTIPLGNDGLPTLDYRHTADTIRAVLARQGDPR